MRSCSVKKIKLINPTFLFNLLISNEYYFYGINPSINDKYETSSSHKGRFAHEQG